MSSYSIFSIDGVEDPHKLAKFLRHMDGTRAMGDLSGKLIMCHGCWEGQIELSFIMNKGDFEDFVRPYSYVEGQECLLWVSGGSRMQCSVETLSDGSLRACGTMKEVSRDTAYKSSGWTYRPDVNKFWILV